MLRIDGRATVEFICESEETKSVLCYMGPGAILFQKKKKNIIDTPRHYYYDIVVPSRVL